MKLIVAIILSVFLYPAVSDARPPRGPAPTHDTYYVRMDGGTHTQCTGRHNAPYPGSGVGQACAWASLHVALPTNDAPRILGGDTVYVAPGNYKTGWGGAGVDQSSRCAAAFPYGCFMAAIPSGPDPAHKTRIMGMGYSRGECRTPPELWGTQRVSTVLNLEGSSNVAVSCLEITDRSDCVESHSNGATACRRDSPPYGDWASKGVSAAASSNVNLVDLDIHGLAHTGIYAGNLSNWSLRGVNIVANGWVGWDGDIGANSSNSGSMKFRNVEIAWNGCGQRWQSGEIHGCWAQQTGGYGDGLGTATTAGHWLFEDSFIHHNTSDGLDMLYLNGSANSSVTVRRVYAQGNAGNAIKTTGRALIENSVIVGDCAYFFNKFFMTSGDQCRALGNTISITMSNNQPATVRHNTVSGQGDCLLFSQGGNASSTLAITNNAWAGHNDWTGGANELTCGHYFQSQPGSVSYAGNLFWNVKSGFCPTGSVCNQNPQFTNGSLANFDPLPLNTSPLVNRVPYLPAAGSDFYHKPRPDGPASDIGAVEVQLSPVRPRPPGRQ